MSHLSRSLLERHFRSGKPLSPDEFDQMHLHLRDCDRCRDLYVGYRDEARVREGAGAGDVLTDRQLETIQAVVLEKHRRAQLEQAPSHARRGPPVGTSVRQGRAWFWGAGGALAAVCAAVVLYPMLRHTDYVGVKGGEAPARDLLCVHSDGDSVALREGSDSCAPGATLAISAFPLARAGLGFVSIVECDDAFRCRLVEAREVGRDPVTVAGPVMEDRRVRLFTIWARQPITRDEVTGAAGKLLRNRERNIHVISELPLDQPNAQLATTVEPGRPGIH